MSGACSEVEDGYIEGHHRRFWQASTDHRGTPGELTARSWATPFRQPSHVATYTLTPCCWVLAASPGRVVTLAVAEDNTERVWGKVYRIAPSQVDAVMAHLDYREKGGYTMKEVTVTVPTLAQSVVALVYTGTPASEEWVGGSETVEDIAQVIATAHGPSGPNCVYLFNLAEAIAMIAPDERDEHLTSLVTRVKELQLLASANADG